MPVAHQGVSHDKGVGGAAGSVDQLDDYLVAKYNKEVQVIVAAKDTAGNHGWRPPDAGNVGQLEKRSAVREEGRLFGVGYNGAGIDEPECRLKQGAGAE